MSWPPPVRRRPGSQPGGDQIGTVTGLQGDGDAGEDLDGADKKVPGMRAHLAGCPACGEDYRSLRDLLA